MVSTHTLYSFKRNENEEVRFSIREYKARLYVDVRIFFAACDSCEYRPTRKGLTLPVAFLGELKRGIEKAESELVANA